MPSLQGIRQFNEHLTALGNEPEVVAGWGEDLEELSAPEEGLDSDLSTLLADTGLGSGGVAGADLAGEEVDETGAA